MNQSTYCEVTLIATYLCNRFLFHTDHFILLFYDMITMRLSTNANSETEDDLIDDAVYKVAPIKPTWKSETECMFKHELSHKHQNKINDIDLQLNNMLLMQ